MSVLAAWTFSARRPLSQGNPHGYAADRQAAHSVARRGQNDDAVVGGLNAGKQRLPAGVPQQVAVDRVAEDVALVHFQGD
eukprot:13406779-Alexandrium_andersonii.AAC.1